jgi:hypothetical protein
MNSIPAEKSSEPTADGEICVLFDREQNDWLGKIAIQFSVAKSRLVRALAANEITLPWPRLQPPPQFESKLRSHVDVPVDQATRRIISQHAQKAGFREVAAYVRELVLRRIPPPVTAEDPIMLLPSGEEVALRQLISLAKLLPPPRDGEKWPNPADLRTRVARRGIGSPETEAANRIASLHQRTLNALRFGGRAHDVLARRLEEILKPLLTP